MRLYRTYHPQPIEKVFPQDVQLADDSFHHLIKVLRLGVGEEIHLVDNSDGHFVGNLSQVNKKNAIVTIKEYVKATNESPIHIHLIQGISRGDRMDLTIQKAVELGVTEITPVFTERCGVSLKGERLEKKVEHWQQIAISACLQSYRDTIPQVNPPVDLYKLLNQLDTSNPEEIFINLNPFAGTKIKEIDPKYKKFTILIGSEGGLSDGEINKALEAGFKDFRLGPRVLRTETTALTVITILQSQFGDM